MKTKKKKILVLWGFNPNKEELNQYRKQYKGQYSEIRIYDKLNELPTIELVDTDDIWWWEVKFLCNRGLLPKRHFYKLPEKIRKSSSYRKLKRSGCLYAVPDGIYFDPDNMEFVHISTEYELY